MRLMSIRSLPNPRITTSSPPWPGSSGAAGGAGLGARLVHERAHAADGAVEPTENGLADQEMADIQLGNGRDDGHRADGIEREAVAGVTFEAEVAGEGRRLADTLQAGAHPFAVGSLQVGIAVGAGVQLDDR